MGSATTRLFEQHAHELAAVVVEPVAAGRRRDALLQPALPAPAARTAATRTACCSCSTRSPPGFGPDRHDVGRRPRRRRAGHAVRRQGADRRLPHARRGAVHDRGRRGRLRDPGRRAHARADVHGQPAGLRGRLRQPGPAAPGRTGPARWRGSRPGCGGARAGRATLPQVLDVRVLGRRRGGAAATSRSTWRARPTRRWRPGCGCGRSATSSTRCRRTSAPTTTSPRSRGACSRRSRRVSLLERLRRAGGGAGGGAALTAGAAAARGRRRPSSTWPATTTWGWRRDPRGGRAAASRRCARWGAGAAGVPAGHRHARAARRAGGRAGGALPAAGRAGLLLRLPGQPRRS